MTDYTSTQILLISAVFEQSNSKETHLKKFPQEFENKFLGIKKTAIKAVFFNHKMIKQLMRL
jgi:hypothetical protein